MVISVLKSMLAVSDLCLTQKPCWIMISCLEFLTWSLCFRSLERLLLELLPLFSSLSQYQSHLTLSKLLVITVQKGLCSTLLDYPANQPQHLGFTNCFPAKPTTLPC